MSDGIIENLDELYLADLRENVTKLWRRSAKALDSSGNIVLDIAPQIHAGVGGIYTKAQVRTLDIDPNSGADYIMDICQRNDDLPGDQFDGIICTEVLEHTLYPWLAVKEIFRLLRPGGLVYVSTPYNFRTHGPSPDCWRFTDQGLRHLFTTISNFEIIDLEPLIHPTRKAMPVQFTLIARKPL